MSEMLTSQVMEVEDKFDLNYLTNKEVNILIMKETKKIRILHFLSCPKKSWGNVLSKFIQWFLPFIQRERRRLCRKGISASVSAPTTIQRVLPSFFSPSDDLTQDHDQLRLHQLTTRSRSIHPTELRFRIYEASRTLLLP